MLRPSRLLLVLFIGALAYMGFVATPPGDTKPGTFDPARVAEYEVDGWKALHTHEDISTYVSAVMMVREQHRYTWFRAVQHGYYLGRAMNSFVGLQTRYERVLPDLETAASIEKAWTNATFEPPAVARAQLDWWVTRKMPNLNTLDAVSGLMAQEYALRYHTDSSRTLEAATLRAQAAELRDQGGTDPDWISIGKLLTESYKALGGAILRTPTSQKAKK